MGYDLFGNLVVEAEPLGVPYMGSKRKYANKLICKMLEAKPHARYFYDLFGGGGAMSFAALQKGMKVIYNEKQTDLVDFMRFLFERMKQPRNQFGMFPEDYYRFVTREDFMRLKQETGAYSQFVRICYSFGNNQKTYMFNPELEKAKHLLHDVVVFQCQESLNLVNTVVGVSLQMPTEANWNDRRLNIRSQIRKGRKRFDLEQLERLQRLEQLHQLQRLQRLEQLEQLEQLQRLQRLERLELNITFLNLDYKDVEINTPIEETIVYLDPPYRNTAKYIEGLDHVELDDFFRELPYLAFMSEYAAPFKDIYTIETFSTFSRTGNKAKVYEKLFINHLSIPPKQHPEMEQGDL